MALIRVCLLALFVLAPAIAQGRERCAEIESSTAGGKVSVDARIRWPLVPWGTHSSVSWRAPGTTWGVVLDLFYKHGAMHGFGTLTAARVSIPLFFEPPSADFRFFFFIGKKTWTVVAIRSSDAPFSSTQGFVEQAIIDANSQPDLFNNLKNATKLVVIARRDRPIRMETLGDFSLGRVAVEARDDLLADARREILHTHHDCSPNYDEIAPAFQYLCGDTYGEDCPTTPGGGRMLALRP